MSKPLNEDEMVRNIEQLLKTGNPTAIYEKNGVVEIKSDKSPTNLLNKNTFDDRDAVPAAVAHTAESRGSPTSHAGASRSMCDSSGRRAAT
jgi:hypothetical protein